jgi:hypothetical protein
MGHLDVCDVAVGLMDRGPAIIYQKHIQRLAGLIRISDATAVPFHSLHNQTA